MGGEWADSKALRGYEQPKEALTDNEKNTVHYRPTKEGKTSEAKADSHHQGRDDWMRTKSISSGERTSGCDS